jgi:hypothetical protein
MKVLHWIIALCGLWEFGDIALPFVIGVGHVQALVWSHILAGLILILVGAHAALTRDIHTARTMDWIAAIAGLWLIVAPFLLGSQVIAAGRWNDIIVGALVCILGVWAAVAALRGMG